MAALSECLREHLIRNWREDLEPNWREMFEGAEPDLERLPDWDVPDLFPERLQLARLRENGDVVAARHMLRAFDGLAPEAVRVVILGQYPYPRRAAATGRAFEDGDWDEGRPTVVAKSLRALLQLAAAYERPELGISEESKNWDRVAEAIQTGELSSPGTPNYFDALAGQGVLCVNAAWTFTGKNKA